MTLEQRVISLEQQVTRLTRAAELNKQQRTWINAGQLKKLTGWNNNQVQYRRDNKSIVSRMNKTGGVEYLLESIDKIKVV